MPPVVGPGVPMMTAVPSPLSTRLTPAGRAPADKEYDGVGNPVALNSPDVPRDPVMKVAAGGPLRIGASLMVSVNTSVGDATTLLAVMVMVCGPPVPAAGVPASVAVPS